MPKLFLAVMVACLALAAGAPQAWAAAPQRTPLELAAAVERRAGATSFAELEEFGRAALIMPGREGLNRLYHVTWIILNQGEFDRARQWNRRLDAAARRQNDARYVSIAHLNDLTILYDQGDADAAAEMRRIVDTTQDWFVRAHAARLTALALMDEDRLGAGLRLLSDVGAAIPADAPFAATAQAGLWEVAGIGLMKLNDFEGAATAFGRFEIDYSDPRYPRPDFDSLYNLTRLAAQVGDHQLAGRLYESHHRLTVRADLESLSVYDANLCAMVAEARQDSAEVLRCLAPYGVDLGAASFMAPHLLPKRAIAYARTGQVALARRDLGEIRRRMDAGTFREEGSSEIPHIEAEILFAEGRASEAYPILRDHFHDSRVQTARRFSAGIGQVTGDMQEQLAERRRQLETASANTELQGDVIRSQRWMFAIAVIFLLSAIGALAWQWRLTRHLSAARRRAEDANRSKSEFLANMSHEIRTPLNGVVAMADALTQAGLPAREREMVEIIRNSGVTLERLLSDILDSAKIESGQVTIEPSPFHLGDAVREVVALWRQTADEKGVGVAVSVDPTLERMVVGDGVRIGQVLANLVSNALKFTTEGTVNVCADPADGERVRFTVTDTGVGFDADQKQRIFTRFQQADGSITRRFGGTGLGLAISRDLAGLMGGTLDCASEPGQGSTFWFEVPLPEAEGAGADAAGQGAGAPPQNQSLRILLADDHPANRKVVEVMLSGTDAELVCVADGQQAVEAFGDGGFDLVLMDMQMPVMDGLAATAEIRRREADGGLRRTPIIMLTANAMAEHVAAGRAAGADRHLSKPITMTSLFEAITGAVAPEQAPDSPDGANRKTAAQLPEFAD